MFYEDDVLYACTINFKDESIKDFLKDYKEICDKIEEMYCYDYEISIWGDFIKKYSNSYFCKFINKFDLSELLCRYKVKYDGLPVHLMTDFEYNILAIKGLYDFIEEKKLPVDSYTVLCVDVVLKEEDLELLKNNPKDYTVIIDDPNCIKNDKMNLGITASYPSRFKGEVNCYNAFYYLRVQKKDINFFEVDIENLDFKDYNRFNHSSYHFAHLRKNE